VLFQGQDDLLLGVSALSQGALQRGRTHIILGLVFRGDVKVFRTPSTSPKAAIGESTNDRTKKPFSRLCRVVDPGGDDLGRVRSIA
jgi:hypothetical protein